MFGIFATMMELLRLGPREFFKQRFKLPVIRFVDNTLDIFKDKARTGLSNTKDVVIKGSIVAFITSSLVWLSIFMYLAFYYTYVPSIAHERPVHLKFTQAECYGVNNVECGKSISEHSYLSAHVELTKRQQLLMLGQPYKIHLDLEMPESLPNKQMGMFMICADFRAKNRELIAQSCRSSMLHYRSPLLEILYTVVYSPLFIFGTAEEKQNLHIELFSNYEEQEGPAVTDVYIEIQSKHIELYSAKFLINAEFTGLRYFMFNFPLLSAAIGISSNLFFIACVCMISWYQVVHSEEYKKYLAAKQNKLKIEKIEEIQSNFDDGNDSYSSSSIEDISMVDKYRDKSSDSDIVELKSEKCD